MSFKQFIPCEPKKSTGKIFNVNDGTGIKKVKDDTKNALARARWGNNWHKDKKKERKQMQADFRKKNDTNAVFGDTSGETKSSNSTSETKSSKSCTKSVYQIELFQKSEFDETIMMHSTKITNTEDMLDEKWNSADFDFDSMANITFQGPDYWTPYMQRERDGVVGEVDEFPIAIKSQWSDYDGAHILCSTKEFKSLDNPNDVIDALLLHFPNGFGPYEENEWGNVMSFPINNDVFMIDIELFNELTAASKQILMGEGKNSLVFPNIWIVNSRY
jgi:hypothetical protein